jgi:hypothetical protein
MTGPLPGARFEAAGHGYVRIGSRDTIRSSVAWKGAFAGQRRDFRSYEIVEDTLEGFTYGYLILEDPSGEARAVQPFFVLEQDLLHGAGPVVRRLAARVRRRFPRFLILPTLMLGCVAGEGGLDAAAESRADWIVRALQETLVRVAREVRARLIVFKEFPARYRGAMSRLTTNGYTRIPSLPMTRLNIDYPSFDEFMARGLGKATRKSLRRKFRAVRAAEPLTLAVVGDATPFVDEIYPLYLQVFERAQRRFEKLSPSYLCRIGAERPERTRFFIWRQNGKAVAFSLCSVEGDALHDEYLGMDYAVAHDLHLYHYTLRDVITWAIANGLQWYHSTATSYDPKLHLGCELEPLDLYVAHTWPPANFLLKLVLPWLEPTRNEPVLAEFPNVAALHGET